MVQICHNFITPATNHRMILRYDKILYVAVI